MNLEQHSVLCFWNNSVIIIDRIHVFTGIFPIKSGGGLLKRLMGLLIIIRMFIVINMMKTPVPVLMAMSKFIKICW